MFPNRLGFLLSALLLAPHAHGLMLGTTEVPKEKIVVYLMIGHSNMCGMDYSHSDGLVHPRAWNYTWSTTKAWVAAKETPGAMRNGLAGRGSGGQSMPFLKGMTAAYPDYYFGVVTNASLSSTCRGENTGNNSSGMDPEDNRYWKGARLYNEIVIAAKAIQADVTLGGILCMLGTVEATRTPEAVCRSFSDDLAQLARDLRADLNSPALPFIMGEYEQGSTGSFSPALPLPAIILQETRLLPTKLENSATIDSKGIAMFDDHHYSANVGHPEWTRRAVAAIQARKWFPPPAATAILIRPGSRRLTASRADLGFFDSRGLTVVSDSRGQFTVNGKLHNPERNHAILQP